jgi:hypothetical protein
MSLLTEKSDPPVGAPLNLAEVVAELPVRKRVMPSDSRGRIRAPSPAAYSPPISTAGCRLTKI